MMSEGLLGLVLSRRQAVPSRTEFGLTRQLAVSYGIYVNCVDFFVRNLHKTASRYFIILFLLYVISIHFVFT